MFSRDGLKRLLFYAKQTAPIIRFKDKHLHKNGIVLRHDVDFSILGARETAEVEMELDIKSTFFLLLNHYVVEKDFLEMLVINGFEVGLHYDPLVDGLLEDEVDKLEQLAGQRVHSVSVHNPSVHGMFPEFSGFINTYDGFSDDTYMSDSLMSFRGKDPYEFIDRAETNLIQIVLHPVYYSSLRY